MKIAIIANCQGSVLKSHINANMKDIEFIEINAVHLIRNNPSEISRVFQEIENADYIITQPLSEGFSKLSLKNLKSSYNEKLIVVPVVFFQGYHPSLCYLKKNGVTFHLKNFDYHDLGIIFCYLKKYTLEETLAMEQMLTINKEELNTVWNSSIQNLIEKEKECDITISDFILENTHERQFYTFNHPSRIVMNYLSSKVVDKIDSNIEYKFIHNDLLSNTIYPLDKNIQKLKNMDISSLYKVNGIYYTSKEIVELYFDEYEKLDVSILQETLDFYSNSIIEKMMIQKYENYDKGFR